GIADRAVEEGVVLLGPNCMGVGAPGELSLWIGTVPETFRPGRISVVSQSGSIAEALLGIGPRVGFRSVVSSGGEMVSGAAEFLDYFAEDEATGAIGLFLETVRRPPEFADALARCAEAGKPVVCLKVGRSQAAARAALAHTGAVVGSARAFSAVLHRHGAIDVHDFTALVETPELSGGFPNYVAPGNPLDAWAIEEAELVFPGSIDVLVGSGAYDIVVAQADQSQFRGAEEHEWCFMIVRALAEATAGTDVFPAVA